MACKKCPYGIPKDFTYNDKDTAVKWNKAYAQTDAISWYRLWVKILDAYSRCFLTYDSDKAVALSGVAKHIRTAVNDVYVAGMWRTFLNFELPWSRTFWDPGVFQHSMFHPQKYRAPTWSWLSVDGPIYA